MTLSETVYTGTNNKKSYAVITGTTAEVLQALADNGVNKDQIVEMKNDATFVVYSRR